MKFFKTPEAVMRLADLLYVAGYPQASNAVEVCSIIGGAPNECELDYQYIQGLIKIFNSLENQDPGYIWEKKSRTIVSADAEYTPCELGEFLDHLESALRGPRRRH